LFQNIKTTKLKKKHIYELTKIEIQNNGLKGNIDLDYLFPNESTKTNEKSIEMEFNEISGFKTKTIDKWVKASFKVDGRNWKQNEETDLNNRSLLNVDLVKERHYLNKHFWAD